MDLKVLYNQRADLQKALFALGAIESGDDARDLTEDELKAHATHIDELQALDAKIARALAVRDAELAVPSGGGVAGVHQHPCPARARCRPHHRTAVGATTARWGD